MNSRIACVGHNTVDKYINHGMMYPGGNEVNVAALAARQGTQSSYIGWVGNDVYGKLITDSLVREGVDISHCLVKDDVNNFVEIFLENGERRFGDVRRGASTRSTLSEDDLEFIQIHDLLHTSYYSRMEEFIKNRPKNMFVSFDFTELASENYLTEYLPYVDIAIIPVKKDTRDIENLLQKYHQMGAKLLLVTMGSHGAYVYDGTLYFQPAIKAKVLDTLGAGDSFIAKFIVEHLKGSSHETAMSLATKEAYNTCMHYGAFGYGMKIPDDKK